MAAAATSLRRLLGPDIRRLLDDAAAAVPGLSLAVVEPDGGVAYASHPDTPDPTAGAGRRDDLSPRGEPLGWLVSVGEAPRPLLDSLGRSVTLLLREALDKHDLGRETLERYREINVLYRVSETIGACLDTALVPTLLLAETERVIPASAGVVLLHDGDGFRTGAVRGDGETLAHTARELIRSVADAGQPDISISDRESAMAVPILAGAQRLGVAALGRAATERPFTAGDEKLFLGLAGQAGIAIERARLHEQETIRQRLEEELAVARRIQLTLLPAHPPVVSGWSFAAAYQAAREVGGDFYDFIEVGGADEGRRLGLVIADVTGKGVPAALMMAYARAVLRAEAAAGKSPVQVLEGANRLIMQERQQRLFLSAYYAELELDTGRLVYASAGHDAPLLLEGASGSVRELDAPGVVLGAFADMGLESGEVRLAPGDTVVFFTDGVTEARDPHAQLFGDDRLRAVLTAVAGDAASVLHSIVDEVAAFTAGAPQADDLTLLVVQRLTSADGR